MSLTTQQILTLNSISGIGKKSILKVGNYRDIPIKTSELPDILARCSVKMKTIDGEKVFVTAQDIANAERKANDIIAKSVSMGIGIISYYEPIFPQRLRDTKSEDGKKLDAPILLFFKGNLEVLKFPCIAVIGTRENSSGVEKAGVYLSREFARRGFCIVSGLALGCDTMGHRGALDVGGYTIAFLAHGLDSVYPPQNTELANEIVARGGLLLSEYEIGTPVSRYNLVARDRLQAGLSMATLVIQTGVNGGTMHAAQNTANSGKPLYVVKYTDSHIDQDERTQGNHLLVEKMGAKYISVLDSLDSIAISIKHESKIMSMCQCSLL